MSIGVLSKTGAKLHVPTHFKFALKMKGNMEWNGRQFDCSVNPFVEGFYRRN